MPGRGIAWFRGSNARLFAAWWWTVDKLTLAALLGLMLAGVLHHMGG